jgi:hypothetical protein
MTKFRAYIPLLACATALALSTATTAAASFSELQGISTEIKTVDLPSPPKPAAPSLAPRGPLAIGKEMDRTSTPLAQPAKPSAPAAKLKSIKAK